MKREIFESTKKNLSDLRKTDYESFAKNRKEAVAIVKKAKEEIASKRAYRKNELQRRAEHTYKLYKDVVDSISIPTKVKRAYIYLIHCQYYKDIVVNETYDYPYARRYRKYSCTIHNIYIFTDLTKIKNADSITMFNYSLIREEKNGLKIYKGYTVNNYKFKKTYLAELTIGNVTYYTHTYSLKSIKASLKKKIRANSSVVLDNNNLIVFKTTKRIMLSEEETLDFCKGFLVNKDFDIKTVFYYHNHSTVIYAFSFRDFLSKYFEGKFQSIENSRIKITKDSIITDELYHKLTGACHVGIKTWKEANGLEEVQRIKVKKLLPILKKTNAYGYETLLTYLEN